MIEQTVVPFFKVHNISFVIKSEPDLQLPTVLAQIDLPTYSGAVLCGSDAEWNVAAQGLLLRDESEARRFPVAFIPTGSGLGALAAELDQYNDEESR